MDAMFTFDPFVYQPKMAGGSDAATSMSGLGATSGSNSGSRSGGMTTISRDIRFAYDLSPVSRTIDNENGTELTIAETFLGFPGDGTAQKLLLFLAMTGDITVLGKPTNSPLTNLNGFQVSFNVRVVQRDLTTKIETVIYPNTVFTQLSKKIDIVEPAASVSARQPLFLIIASGQPLVTGGVDMPGWNGDGPAPQTPIRLTPLRLFVTMQLLTSSVA